MSTMHIKGLAFGLLLACGTLQAQSQHVLAGATRSGPTAEVTLHFRSYYFDRLNPGDVTQAAWAAGGWVGYHSGWIGDVLRFGVGRLHLAEAVGPAGQGRLGPAAHPDRSRIRSSARATCR